MFKVIELEIDPTLSGETGVFEVAWVEYPAIEQDMMVFSKQKFYKAPDYVSDKACQAIRENEKRGNPAGTQVGKVRAQQLCQKQEISLETIKRMKSYLERAATYNTGNWDDNGTIAYGLWGGPDALTWVDKILNQQEDFQDDGLENACWEGYEPIGMKPMGGRMVPNCVPVENSKQDFAECPPATKSISINLKNRQNAVDVANYGPLNPNEPNDKYWEAKAKQFNTTIGEAKSALCGNCAFFNVSPRIKDCISQGISDQPYDTIEAGELGYCEAFDFKCAAKRTCDAWVVGGPVQEEKFVYPSAGEEKDAFISRCVGVVVGEGKSQDEALGQCYGMWENKNFAFQKVSFDWDGVLSTDKGKRFLEQEIGFGNYVYIISARSAVTNEMRMLANKYKIPQDRIFAVGSNNAKVKKINELGIMRHYDDNPVVKLQLPTKTVLFDYDTSAIGGYVDYPDSGSTNSMLVEPAEFDCGCGMEKSNTYFEEADMDIFGYLAKHFEICPGAIGLFEHLKTMNPDFDTQGMIRSAAQIADNVFEIEKMVIERGYADQSDYNRAAILVDDFKDLMREIDELIGMNHDVSFMDGHLVIISDYIDAYDDEDKEIAEALKTLKNSKEEKFEAVTNELFRGLTEDQVKRGVYRNGQKFYRYDRVYPKADSRDFCMSIEGRYFRRVIIDALRDYNTEFGHNRQPYSKWLYLGGPNCVHAFRQFEYRSKYEGPQRQVELVDQGFAAGLPGTPMIDRPLQGYYSEETRAKSKRAYAIQRSQQGFNATYMDEKQVQKCFGDLCQVGFSKNQDQLFAAVAEKRMIYTPLMIPNILIPRIDEVSREKYYVKFTPETISKIAKKFAIEGRNRKTNYEHSNQKFNDVVMVESWIVEGENDKAYQLGFSQEQIPVGTWMGGYYVLETPEGEDVWKNYIKNGKVRGASVEGNFILNFSALRDDDYLLGQIINILKNISENER